MGTCKYTHTCLAVCYKLGVKVRLDWLFILFASLGIISETRRKWELCHTDSAHTTWKHKGRLSLRGKKNEPTKKKALEDKRASSTKVYNTHDERRWQWQLWICVLESSHHHTLLNCSYIESEREREDWFCSLLAKLHTHTQPQYRLCVGLSFPSGI